MHEPIYISYLHLLHLCCGNGGNSVTNIENKGFLMCISCLKEADKKESYPRLSASTFIHNLMHRLSIDTYSHFHINLWKFLQKIIFYYFYQ